MKRKVFQSQIHYPAAYPKKLIRKKWWFLNVLAQFSPSIVAMIIAAIVFTDIYQPSYIEQVTGYKVLESPELIVEYNKKEKIYKEGDPSILGQLIITKPQVLRKRIFAYEDFPRPVSGLYIHEGEEYLVITMEDYANAKYELKGVTYYFINKYTLDNIHPIRNLTTPQLLELDYKYYPLRKIYACNGLGK